MPISLRLPALLLPAFLGLNLAQAQVPTPVPALPHTKPLRLPGETQPIAPGTRRAAPIPELTLTPPMPQVRQIQYLSNGHIEVASAVLLLLSSEVAQARKLAATAAARTLLARPSLAEVDVSVYNKTGYGGFGGPLPILTLSAPRARLQDVAAWAAGGTYERAWEALGSTPPNPGNADRIADKVRERTINFFGDVNQTLSDARTRTASQVRGRHSGRSALRRQRAQAGGGPHLRRRPAPDVRAAAARSAATRSGQGHLLRDWPQRPRLSLLRARTWCSRATRSATTPTTMCGSRRSRCPPPSPNSASPTRPCAA